MNLKEWLNRNADKSIREHARNLGLERPTLLCQYRDGDRTPKLPWAIKLAAYTNHEVTVADFFPELTDEDLQTLAASASQALKDRHPKAAAPRRKSADVIVPMPATGTPAAKARATRAANKAAAAPDISQPLSQADTIAFLANPKAKTVDDAKANAQKNGQPLSFITWLQRHARPAGKALGLTKVPETEWKALYGKGMTAQAAASHLASLKMHHQ